MKLHHIGWFVSDIHKGVEAFKALGFRREGDIVIDTYRKIEICFVYSKDGGLVELVHPYDKSSVAYGLFRKYGGGVYHCCYEVQDIQKSIIELRKEHYVICEEPHSAIAIDGKMVAFLINSKVGMIELLETGEEG